MSQQKQTGASATGSCDAQTLGAFVPLEDNSSASDPLATCGDFHLLSSQTAPISSRCDALLISETSLDEVIHLV